MHMSQRPFWTTPALEWARTTALPLAESVVLERVVSWVTANRGGRGWRRELIGLARS